jgi:hypothetical protein
VPTLPPPLEQFSCLVLRFELNRGGRNAFGDKPIVLAMFIILFSSRSKINQAMNMNPFAFVIDYHMTIAPCGYQSQGML